ncbi:hypothetical protein BDV93DRAFT_574255, partial [Ceratobasidium sp. AG-I]
FGVTYTKIGTIQRRLAWPLHKDDTLVQSGRSTDRNIYFAFYSFMRFFLLRLRRPCIRAQLIGQYCSALRRRAGPEILESAHRWSRCGTCYTESQ